MPGRGPSCGRADRQDPTRGGKPLATRSRVCRNDRNKERAVAYLPPDPMVPDVSASKLALVEPDFDARCKQGTADPLRRFGILRGVTQEHGPRRRAPGS
jgi:hypothetical protein